MSRRIPRGLLSHVDQVSIEPYLGASAAGRQYGPAFTIARTLILDGTSLIGSQYERETDVSGAVYCDREALDVLPVPDSRVKLWLGTPDEHDAFVKRTERYKDDRLADVIVIVLR